jgi:hypothetical protein
MARLFSNIILTTHPIKKILRKKYTRRTKPTANFRTRPNTNKGKNKKTVEKNSIKIPPE